MQKKDRGEVSEEILLEYGRYCQIALSLQHYNRIQTTYRTFTSTWLIATFLGIGYVLSALGSDLPFPPFLVAAFICLASSTGISLVWYMDLIICEQHIAALVIDGIELEETHKWLPNFYSNVNKMTSFLSYISLKTIFYIGCLSILFITMGASISILLQSQQNVLFAYIPLLTISFICLISYAMIFAMKKSDPYFRLEKIKKTNV